MLTRKGGLKIRGGVQKKKINKREQLKGSVGPIIQNSKGDENRDKGTDPKQEGKIHPGPFLGIAQRCEKWTVLGCKRVRKDWNTT